MSGIYARVDRSADALEFSGQRASVGAWTVVADATLYYVEDLLRRLPAPGPDRTPAALIAAALDHAGPAALDWLEGDYAFIAQHRSDRRVLAARDFGGKRSLFFTVEAGSLVIGSDLRAVVAGHGTPRGVDLATVATVAAGMWSHDDATAYHGVRELRAGHALEWTPSNAPVSRMFWRAPSQIAPRRLPLEPAVEELRALLDEAVRQRLAAAGPTAVSLSGGWDSTAVYTSACAAGADVKSISISYPIGDPGREDEWIAETAARWNREPAFIDINAIPLYSDWEHEAARRGAPFAHAYEHWNRRLARGARDAGASILLDGVGGDQLFQCGDIYLADLLRTGQWGELAGQIRQRATGRDALRLLYRWGVEPNLPPRLAAGLARVVGTQLQRDYLERVPPRWFRRDFLQTHRVMEREAAARPPRTVRSHVLAESHAYLTFAFYPRIFAQLAGFGREEGIELRSPLLDERIVRFAAARPWSDRVDGGETKRLLRAAMRGRAPDAVLAPRAHRTGTTNAYFLRELRRGAWPVAERVLPDMRMAALGIIEPSHYRRAWTHVLAHDDDELAARLFFTLQAELWLRTHTS